MESSMGFSQPPPSSPLKWALSTFHYKTSSFCCLPIFSLKTSSSLQKIHNISIGLDKPPHMLFFCFKQNFLFGAPFSHWYWNTLSKEHAVSIDPDGLVNLIRALRDFFINNFLFQWSPVFFVFQHPNRNPPKKAHAMSADPHPFYIPRNKSMRHMNPVISN